MTKQKVYLLLENLDKLDNVNICFVIDFVILASYLFQLIVLVKPDSNCFRSFMFSCVDNVTRGI